MRQIKIDINEHDQRIDRFLKKYFSNASKSFIYKMLRKKRIKLNGAKASPEDIIAEGDTIEMYLSDETIEKFRTSEKTIKGTCNLDIVYEDSNIVLINKPKNMLAHASESESDEPNVVDEFISYLYASAQYDPKVEKTFVPSICNRLDRNTSGLIIGAKNYNTLKEINNGLKNRSIDKYYECIVKGSVSSDQKLEGFLVKNSDNNKVSISKEKLEDSKEIKTDIRVIKKNKNYSLLEINLITGRTHQIRAHLFSIGHPIIGDLKYGENRINKELKEKYKLDNQYLHAYKIIFDGLESGLEYLNKKEFICNVDSNMEIIKRKLFVQ